MGASRFPRKQRARVLRKDVPSSETLKNVGATGATSSGPTPPTDHVSSGSQTRRRVSGRGQRPPPRARAAAPNANPAHPRAAAECTFLPLPTPPPSSPRFASAVAGIGCVAVHGGPAWSPPL
ncbi:hypothetical protein NL676_036011 [Syzygium grande]|nr:hypothetical protein NL676_036011 [Syzygium grande]